MKNRNDIRIPSVEELYAYELEARRLRSIAVAGSMTAAFAAIRSLFARAFAVGPKEVRHA